MKKIFIAPEAKTIMMQAEQMLMASMVQGTGNRPGVAQTKGGGVTLQWN